MDDRGRTFSGEAEEAIGMRFGRKLAAADKLEMLAGIKLFAGCSREELMQLASLFDEVERPPGTVLVREGEAGQEFFVIVEGTLSATLHGRRIASLGPGDFFGEMSLLESAPRAATIVAETAVRLLVVDPRGFSGLVASAPPVGIKMLRIMSQRLRGVEQAVATH
jgi:CRP-like cAMP-binding protein